VLIGDQAAIYVRVSSGKQESGASLDVQLEACQQYCDRMGLEVVASFKDIQSGLDIDRPAYQQALKLAKSKAITHLVVYRYDRTGRDDAEFAGMLRDFTKQNIQLVSASGESPDPFGQKLAGLMAWDESRRLSIRVTGSKVKRHQEGKWGTRAPFGYDSHQLRDNPNHCEVCRVHGTGGSILVPGAQAELVTEMFQRYASGRYSLNDLRDYLRSAGVSKGRYAISYVLRSRVYLGEIPRGRYIDSQFHETPAQTWAKGRHQPLVDEDTFNRVQARLDENQHRQKGGPGAKYLFSGIIYCGTCGAKYQGRPHTWQGVTTAQYRCNRRRDYGDCLSHSISESRIKAEVIPPIERLLSQLNRQDLRTAVRAELARQQAESQATDRVTKLSAVEELKRLEHRLSQWEDMVADGEMPRERFAQRRDEVLPRIKELQAKLEERPHLALPDIDQLFAIADAIASDVVTNWDQQSWREMVEGVLEKIIINDHDIKVDWKPEFATMLQMVLPTG
jgi:site-specific DNA recombinase